MYNGALSNSHKFSPCSSEGLIRYYNKIMDENDNKFCLAEGNAITTQADINNALCYDNDGDWCLLYENIWGKDYCYEKEGIEGCRKSCGLCQEE